MKEGHDFKLLLMEMNQYIRDYIADRGLAYYEQKRVYPWGWKKRRNKPRV